MIAGWLFADCVLVGEVVALIILAGGQSTRLGRDKSQLELDGLSIMEALGAQLGFAGETIIAAADPERFVRFRARVVPDSPGCVGPLAGIAAGLAASEDAANLIVACDMPFPSPLLAREMLEAIATAYDAAVPCPGGWPEPTFAAYGRACLPAIERRLRAGLFKVTGFYDDVRTLRLCDQRLAGCGPAELVFLNVNTEQDLRRAEELLPQARALGCWPRESPRGK